MNDGSIEGAAVELKAHGNMYALAINNKGSIRATGASNSGGRVFLNGVGGSVESSGSITATAPSAGSSASVLIEAAYAKVDGRIEASGGDVRISATEDLELGGSVDVSSATGLGGDVVVEGSAIDFANTSEIDASGFTGGGNVRVGGGFQGKDAEIRNAEYLTVAEGSVTRVDATGDGDAGSAIFWADRNTLFKGEISGQAMGAVGNGGFAEVSGKEQLAFGGLVNLGDGTLLLDPDDYEVSAAWAADSITNALNVGTNVVIYTNPADTGVGGTGQGHIRILYDIVTDTDGANGSLTLLAAQDIYIARDILSGSAGGGDINLVAGWDGTTGFDPATDTETVNTPHKEDHVAVDMDTMFFDQAGTYGNRQGSIIIGRDIAGGTAPDGISVGSRAGSTNAVGYDFSLFGGTLDSSGGSDNYTQFGYRAWTSGIDPSGDIRVQALNDVVLTANQATAWNEDDSYVMIGHGGDGQLARQAMSGDIKVEAGNNIDLNGGVDQWNFAQIGHGGRASNASATEVSLNGKITVDAGNLLSLDAGTGNFSFARIGLGGLDMRVNASSGGDIDVDAGSIVANAGLGGRLSEVQIGHGGFNAEYVTTGTTTANYTFGGWYGSIDVTTTSGDITFKTGAERSGAQIGHGGGSNTGNHGYDVDAGTDDALNSKITVQSAGAITFDATTSVSGVSQFAQIGHGGWQAAGDHIGDIKVSAVDAITFTAGSQEDSYAMIGNGGNEARGDHAGDIDVSAGGNISFTAGTGTHAHAMIGHGGYDADGPNGDTAQGNSGDISVVSTGGNIELKGSDTTAEYAFSMIGHGGGETDGANTGHISLDAAGSLSITSGTGKWGYSRVGHGGYNVNGDHAGDIFVHTGTGISLESVTGGQYGLTQIGHGGYRAAGAHSGFITVINDTGDISLKGADGGTNDRYSQIGHGGVYNLAHTLSGSISVVNLDGDIKLQGGDGAWRAAVIGHGSQSGHADGDRVGGLNLYANGAITMTDGTGNSMAVVGHQTGTVGTDGGVVGVVSYAGSGITAVGDSGFSIVATEGITFGDDMVSGGNASVSLSETIAAAIADGDVTIASGGNNDLDLSAIDTSGSIATALSSFDSPNSITFAAGGDLSLGFGIQNQGAGNVSLIAGWNSAGAGDLPQMDALTTSPFYAAGSGVALGKIALPEFGGVTIPVNSSSYGNNNGALVLGGGAQTGAIRIGSRAGTTTVLGDSITLNAGSGVAAATQLGFYTDGSGDATGAISVGVKDGGLALNSGSDEGAYTQIGHGGLGSDVDLINADISIRFSEAGDVTLNAGGEEAYSQIGHGGLEHRGTRGGAISLLGDVASGGAGSITLSGGSEIKAYSQIGHGGYDADGATTGDIQIRSLGGVVLEGGSAQHAYTQIGHGGAQSNALGGDPARTGNIQIEALGTITAGNPDHLGKAVVLQGGSGSNAYAQIGLGGYNADAVYTGNIRVIAENGGIDLAAGIAGGSAYVQIGNGGQISDSNKAGAIVVRSGGDLNLTGGQSGGTGAQIGHGGSGSKGTKDGLIDVEAAGDISLVGGTAGNASVQIGHGGINSGTASTDAESGSVTVRALGTYAASTGAILLQSQSPNTTFAQIGHGGAAGGIRLIERSGNVTVSAAGDITLDSSEAAGGNFNYTQIGHGGRNNGGDMSGEVAVESGGNIDLIGGTGGGGFALIGHGGRTNAGGTREGGIQVIAEGTISTTNGSDFAFIQHRSLNDGGLAGAGVYLGGNGFQIIGKGGTSFNDAAFGNAADLNAMINGNLANGPVFLAIDNDFDVVLEGVDVLVDDSFNRTIAVGGTINVNRSIQNSGDGDIQLVAGFDQTGATVGGNSTFTPAVFDGTGFNVDTPAALTMEGTLTASAAGTFGNNGNGVVIGAETQSSAVAVGSREGETTVSGGSVALFAGTAADAGTQIGFTGSGDEISGAIEVRAKDSEIVGTAGPENGVFLQSGGVNSYTQIGHSATAANTVISGAVGINFAEAGDLTFTAGGVDAYSQIGHRGSGTGVVLGGSIDISGFTNLTGTAGADRAMAQIGHGGFDSDTTSKSGAITLSGAVGASDGLLKLKAGTLSDASAQIGHGSINGSGDLDGSISITDLHDVQLEAGTANNTFAMIGHGGRSYTGTTDGDSVTVKGSGSLAVSGFTGSQSFAQIGHGGTTARGSYLNSNVDVEFGKTVSLTGGSGLNAYAQIGHGGVSSGNPVDVRTGTITVKADGSDVAGNSITLQAVTSNDSSYAQIGHGGRGSNFSASGLIDVDASGNVSLLSSAGKNGYTQIGHGGVGYNNGNLSGKIEVDVAGGSVFLTAGNGGEKAYSQIGHGGAETPAGSDPAVVSDIHLTVTGGGDVKLRGGTGTATYAQVGHGGTNSEGDKSGAIVIDVDGDLDLLGGASTAYAMVGHGGEDALGNHSGMIDIDAADNVIVAGGSGDSARAQIGHGGNQETAMSTGTLSGIIDVTSDSGYVSVKGGSANRTSAQIGHGGDFHAGAKSDRISVEAATGVTVQGGSNVRVAAQIGHGGYQAEGSVAGDIEVAATAGNIDLLSGGSNGAYSLIGHGGVGNTVATVDSITGNICVHAGAGLVTLNALPGGGDYTFAQIGHGGRFSRVVSIDGDITVVSNGNLLLQGGDNTEEYAQIGHGGRSVNADMSGDLNVISRTGDIDILGGTGTGAYAMLGHGNGEGENGSGTREGGIHIFAQGDFNVVGNANYYHQTASAGGLDTNYLGGDGFQVVVNGTQTIAASAEDDVSDIIEGNLGAGPIFIQRADAFDVVIDDQDRFVDTPGELYIVTGGSITFLKSYQNAGAGNISLLAGWDGSGAQVDGTVSFPDLGGGELNFCEPAILEGRKDVDFNNCDAFGNGMNTVTIGDGTQTGDVIVGSRAGVTRVRGYGLSLVANGGYGAQIGFRPDAAQAGFGADGVLATSGDIDIRLKAGGLSLTSGSATGSYTQIGHGGVGSDDSNNGGSGVLGGDITISFCEPGAVSLIGGGNNSYAQIGHGGAGTAFDITGAISIGGAELPTGYSAAEGITLTSGSDGAYTQIGHGGTDASGSVLGDINLDTDGALIMNGGTGDAASTQIGHGGDAYAGSLQGNIAVNEDGGAGNGAFTLTSGTAPQAFAMLGHGGLDSVGTKDGSITLRSNDSISIINPGGAAGTNGNGAFTQVGHGGQNSSGVIGGIVAASDIELTTDGEILIRGNISGRGGNHTQVGHGGQSAGAAGETVSGAITLNNNTSGNTVSAGFTLIGAEGGAGNTHTQVGHGGYGSNYSTTGAAIKVDLGGDLLIVRSDTQANTQIGHGGEDAKGDYSGNIDIDAAGAITLGGRATGVNSIGAGNIDSSVQIGHGGSNANGSFGGNINVDAGGTIALLPGDGVNGTISDVFTQIGHGGSHTAGGGNTGDGDKTGNIAVTSSGGNITVGGGDRTGAFSQIGHGGSNAGGDKEGTITLTATSGLVDIVGGNAATGVKGNYAQVGHGGETGVGSVDGAITINAGSVSVSGPQSGASSSAYGQIGHGGADYIGDIGLNLNSDISVTGTAGSVVISGGVGDSATIGTYGQIGHGGSGGSGSMKGAINVSALGAGSLVTLSGGTGTQAYAQVGHGGTNRTGDVLTDSDITVNATGGAGLKAVSVTAGEGLEAYTMIGHGGDEAESGGVGYAGKIQVTATAGDIDIAANSVNNRTYAKIGHGAYNTAATVGAFVGDISVTANAGSVLGTAASDGNNNFVQIGHGGIRSGDGHSGIINVIAADDITFQAGTSGSRSDNLRRFAMIGHGGHDVDGDHGGAITVSAGTDGTGNVAINGGDITATNTAAFAQIGHGGEDSSGDFGGNILVTAANDIDLHAGEAAESYSQIGHGGRSSKGDKSGTITVTATSGTVELLGGDKGSAYAQIGHGGHDADFTGAVGGTTAADTIRVTSGSNMLLRGTLIDDNNAAAQAYAQIGHGGQYTEGNHLANVIVNSGGTLDLQAGNSNQSYAQIGHGGLFNGSPPVLKGNQSGNIDVDAVGTINLNGGGRDRSYAQIGHGGNDHDGNLSGNINVDSAAGAVNVLGNGSLDGYAQIGHGGNATNGTKDGHIVVNAASGVKVAADGEDGAYGQIGHGGTGSDGNIGVTAGNITVTSSGGNIDLAGNQGSSGPSYTQIGHGGLVTGESGETASGSITVSATNGDILVTGSGFGTSSSFVQLGHGGLGSAYGVADQMIDLDATGAITLSGGGSENHTMIGHGGERATGAVYSGLIDIDAGGDIVLNGGSNADASAQIGHGGSDTNAVLGGAIQVTSTGGGIATTAGTNRPGTSTQIGHGGTRSQGIASGAITVEAGTEISFVAGVGSGSYTQIGHGGLLSNSERSGEILVTADTGGISFAGSGAIQGYAQLGHGGYLAEGNSSDAITVEALVGEISFTGGSSDQAYAQLGHGGYGVVGTKGGAIKVDAGSVLVEAGSGIESTARIGHGGSRGSGDISGSVSVSTTVGNVEVKGGSGNFTDAAIGAGGTQYDADSILSATSVNSFLDVLVEGGTGIQAGAQVGAGGIESTADLIVGDVDVSAPGSIQLSGGNQLRAFSQIGNGGATAAGDFSGSITVAAGGELFLTAANGGFGAYSQIGHGDDLFSSATSISALAGSGSRGGDIRVSAGTDMVLTDGMIGHVNDASTAIATGGSTQVAVSTNDPADPSVGSLIADSDSEFSGEDEVRFYVPERSSNDVQAGALINGEAFAGAEVDPSAAQRDDEFTIEITGVEESTPGEHSNVFGTGPAPVNAGSFAFYYNSIELTDPAVVPPVDSGDTGGGSANDGNSGGGNNGAGGGGGPLFTFAQFLRMAPDDKSKSDWLRENEARFTGFNPYGMYFEGYDHYDLNGEPVFHFVFTNFQVSE
ncbi:hypothetical protein VSU19_00495 [Verrucomicrobiales bacterium BCK34]|nr:hypothetical protein [Verrucomicrobiales bacterium BCK34]